MRRTTVRNQTGEALPAHLYREYQGLAITRLAEGEIKHYAITHQASGHAIVKYERLAEARTKLLILGDLPIDWTRPADEVVTRENFEIVRKVR